MSDIAETPNLAAPYCPGCDPERDPLQEILVVFWCDEHRPPSAGPDDGRAALGQGALSSLGEAEAETNRPWCEFVHRAANPARPTSRARTAARPPRVRPPRA